MIEEINEIIKQKTWIIDFYNPNNPPLGSKFVYKIKTDNNNNIYKYKSRLVVQGYSQIKYINYEETFASTARPESIRIILIIAIYLDYFILQYDISFSKLSFPI